MNADRVFPFATRGGKPVGTLSLSEKQYYAKSLGLEIEKLQDHVDIALSSRKLQHIDGSPSQTYPEIQAYCGVIWMSEENSV